MKKDQILSTLSNLSLYNFYVINRVFQDNLQMNDNTNNNKILTSPAKAQQIIEYCRQKFINILPNNTPRIHVQQAPQMPNINNIIYKKQQVKQVMRQLSIFLQLVIQNCLLSSDSKIKAQSYRILGNFRNFLSRDLDEFQTMIYNRNKSKLPFYEVECKDFVKRPLDLKIPPQVSLYQDPLLFYIYTRFAQQQLFINHPIHVNREERIQILKHHTPFLDPLFIPILSERLQTKAKFSELEDRLLLILVKSKLDINEYKGIYFPLRAQAQIKNRIKNLCGNGKQINNPIKQIKQNQYIPLQQNQIQQIAKGFQKFGPRWPVIAKYYNIRSGEFLQAEYNNCNKLFRRRQKQKIKPSYESLKILIDSKIQDMSKRKQNQMIMEQQNVIVAEVIDEEKKSQGEGSLMEEQIDQQPQYKIINHMTFQYQEI